MRGIPRNSTSMRIVKLVVNINLRCCHILEQNKRMHFLILFQIFYFVRRCTVISDSSKLKYMVMCILKVIKVYII